MTIGSRVPLRNSAIPRLQPRRPPTSHRSTRSTCNITMSKLLADKFCLVTGGGRGIGAAVALDLAREGASIALVARTESQLKETAEKCKAEGASHVETHASDLTDAAGREELISDLLNRHSAIDVLVNNAGMGVKGTPLEGDIEEWEKMLKLNLHAPMHLTRLVAPGMKEKKGGLRVIINMCSVAGVEPMQSACAYAATKWGLRGWSLSCYQNLRPYGIKVVAVNPGMVNTDMPPKGMDTEMMIQPEDVAAAVMLAVKTKQSCTPQEITLRPTEPVQPAK